MERTSDSVHLGIVETHICQNVHSRLLDDRENTCDGEHSGIVDNNLHVDAQTCRLQSTKKKSKTACIQAQRLLTTGKASL